MRINKQQCLTADALLSSADGWQGAAFLLLLLLFLLQVPLIPADFSQTKRALWKIICWLSTETQRLNHSLKCKSINQWGWSSAITPGKCCWAPVRTLKTHRLSWTFITMRKELPWTACLSCVLHRDEDFFSSMELHYSCALVWAEETTASHMITHPGREEPTAGNLTEAQELILNVRGESALSKQISCCCRH